MLLTFLYNKTVVIIELSIPKNHYTSPCEKIRVLIEDENYENIHI